MLIPTVKIQIYKHFAYLAILLQTVFNNMYELISNYYNYSCSGIPTTQIVFSVNKDD